MPYRLVRQMKFLQKNVPKNNSKVAEIGKIRIFSLVNGSC